MRIGILTHNFPLSKEDRKDAGTFLLDFAIELSKKNKVFVLCPNFSGEKQKIKNVSVTWFEWAGGDKKLGSWKLLDIKSPYLFYNLITQGKKAAIKFAKENKLDFCLSAWALPSGVFASHIKKTLNIRYANWSLGSDINQYAKIPLLKGLIKQVLVEADFRFSNSYFICSKIEKLTGKNAIYLPAITEFNLKKITTSNIKPKYDFLFVGRLEEVKGPDILIKACQILKKENQKFNVCLVGSGSMSVDIIKSIKDFGLEKYIKVWGVGSKEEIVKLMLGSECLVIPSRSESTPLVLIEAVSVSLPVIASDVGDCPRLVEQNIGYIFQSEDFRDLALKMKMVLDSKDNFKTSRKTSLKKVSDMFVQKKVVGQFLNLIK